MRFDELILQDPDGELRIRFHPELTVLSGLGPAERAALATGIISSLTGGEASSSMLRYLNAAGQAIIVRCHEGQLSVDAGASSVPTALSAAAERSGLRARMLLRADDLGTPKPAEADDAPPELRDARRMLQDLTDELDAALGQQSRVEALQHDLEVLEQELLAARDGLARREYAQVLAHLERVRAEAAAQQSSAEGIDADRRLLEHADEARASAHQWKQASEVAAQCARHFDGHGRMDPDERDRLAAIPPQPPEDIDELVGALERATRTRDELDQRLQTISVSKLPAPSDPLVADLGVLDQEALWKAATRLIEAAEGMQRVQLSLGGVELDEMGPPLAVIEEIESAHSRTEAAERAAEAARIPGLAGLVGGAALSLAGLLTLPVLVPVGLAGAATAGVVGVLRPQTRRMRAIHAESAALARADANSYLAFHIRRVEASIDPKLRDLVEATTVEHRAAVGAWIDLVGAEVSVAHATVLRSEIEAYHEALRNLGDTADEIDQLRRELDEIVEPALVTARDQLVGACAPYDLSVVDLAVLGEVTRLLAGQCERGSIARAQVELEKAEAAEGAAAQHLDGLLLELGFEAGPLEARVGALDWAVSRAEEREEARRRARPRAEIETELRTLQEAVTSLRRPEWATVTAADAATPDIAELEARRNRLTTELAEARAEVDVDRLADRHAALERRVAALETRHGGAETGDPTLVADLQQRLMAHLTTAAQAGPDGDPVPVVLDEVLQRVPADRKWDLLDLLHRLAEQHQLIYLSEDAFVAAWAHQRALDGAITLLELAPEPA